MLGHWAALSPTPLPASSLPIDAASLGIWALQFTPRVALLEGVVVAEVSGSARLFGDIWRGWILQGTFSSDTAGSRLG